MLIGAGYCVVGRGGRGEVPIVDGGGRRSEVDLRVKGVRWGIRYRARTMWLAGLAVTALFAPPVPRRAVS